MDCNIFVFNLVILIFINEIKCRNDQPKISSSTPEEINDGYHDLIANFPMIIKASNELHLKFNNEIFSCCDNKLIPPVRHVFDVRYDILPRTCETTKHPTNCAEATACTHASGVYYIIQKKFSNHPFLVWCDVISYGGDWTVIQRRHDGSEDFERVWSDYVNGFGDVQEEFFIGLEKLHVMTNYNGPQELIIILKTQNETKYAKYDNFIVGGTNDSYTLNSLGVYSGNAGDSLKNQLKQKFTTKDRDNDQRHNHNCARLFTGAWWYKDCHQSNLNGKYGDNTNGKGINWYTFRGWQYSIPYVKMMIRRRRYL
ncbi:microfibril-associated glycoprotein 4-like isoform 2-T2 [Cochliomyia hominivorax]